MIYSDLFEIKEGKHRSAFRWTPFIGNKMNFSVELNSSMWYEPTSDHINKLFGFSDGGLNHHNNSVRIGWRPSKNRDRFELFTYIYKEKERVIQYINTVDVGYVNFEILILEDSYIISTYNEIGLNEMRIVNRAKMENGWYKHLLFPYFGGEPKSSQHMQIPIVWQFFNVVNKS